MDIVQVISFLIGFTILVSAVLLIRSGRLKERYSILWLFSSIIICIFSLSRRMLEAISYSLHIYYPPSLLFLIGVLFLLAINISFSVTISELSKKVNILTQEIALLKNKKGKDYKER